MRALEKEVVSVALGQRWNDLLSPHLFSRSDWLVTASPWDSGWAGLGLNALKTSLQSRWFQDWRLSTSGKATYWTGYIAGFSIHAEVSNTSPGLLVSFNACALLMEKKPVCVLNVTLGEECCLWEPPSTSPGCKSHRKSSLPQEVNVLPRQSTRSEELSLVHLWRHVVLLPCAA